jgi:hypothetical protein
VVLMSILLKSNKSSSSRRQINITGVRDNVLILPNEHYRVVLQVSSINFELKSDAEQDALIEIYQSFLNSLACPLQIIVRVRETDMDKYLEDFKTKQAHEPNEVYRAQIDNYCQFVGSLISTNKILSRNFYVVIGFNGDAEFETVKEQLSLNMDIVIKGLSRIGMQSRLLNSVELLDLFYSFYNPHQAKAQPISSSTLDLLNRSYV